MHLPLASITGIPTAEKAAIWFPFLHMIRLTASLTARKLNSAFSCMFREIKEKVICSLGNLVANATWWLLENMQKPHSADTKYEG